MERLIGQDPSGRPGIDQYDIGYEPGGAFSVVRSALGMITESVFSVARWLVRLSTWVTGWALDLQFAEALVEPADTMAATYANAVVGPIGVRTVLLVAAAVYAGAHLLRGRMGRGLSEIAVGLLVATLATAALAEPGQAVLGPSGLFGQVRGLAHELISITAGAGAASPVPGSSPPAATTELTDGIRLAFVETPHQVLNWGQAVDARSPCWAAYQQLVEEGPWGTKDEPRQRMTAVCPELARFNGNPSPDRLMGAVFVLGGVVVVVILLLLIAATLVASQLGLAVLVMLTPVALAAGILPGGGRRLMGKWAAAMLKSLAAVLMTAVFLTLFLTTTRALLAATAGAPLVVQMGLLDVLVVWSFLARRRLLQAGQRAAAGAGARLGRAGGG
ncbi:MAG: type IV secretion system protein, partial [Acidimicrobiales bacterium]